MANTTDNKGPEVLQAEELLKEGISGLVAAFNLTDGRPWAFPPKTRERAMAMLHEVYALFHQGGCTPRTGPALEGGAHFQKFMQQVIGKRGSTLSKR